jgi:hypothetical protein
MLQFFITGLNHSINLCFAGDTWIRYGIQKAIFTSGFGKNLTLGMGLVASSNALLHD